jgi:hypothetical protein
VRNGVSVGDDTVERGSGGSPLNLRNAMLRNGGSQPAKVIPIQGPVEVSSPLV